MEELEGLDDEFDFPNPASASFDFASVVGRGEVFGIDTMFEMGDFLEDFGGEVAWKDKGLEAL